MRDPLKPGDNPRLVFPNHRERGPTRFSFTYADIAAACGMDVGAVRMAAHRKVFDPRDFGSVLRFVSSRSAPAAEAAR